MPRHKFTQLALGLLVLSSSASAFFRLPCKAPVVVARADPIVNPNKISGHVHTIMGGNGFGFAMDYGSTQASTCSSCTVVQDLSNYWVPNLYYKAKNGTFTSVNQAGGATIYYLQRTDEHDVNYPKLEAFPKGFRMLAGDANLRCPSDNVEQDAISYVCLGTSGRGQTGGFPNYKCPGGLRIQVFFPSCWNGVDLDSSDHKSHMAYPNGMDHGACPEGFPHRFISIFYEVIWNTPDFDDMWYGNSQPFILSSGDPTGYGYHGDFVNGWNIITLQSAIDDCTSDDGVIENCSHFDFVTDLQAEACKILPSIDEQVMGTMDHLPGCNPVQAGPGKAIQHTDCDAPTRIGQPQLPYVDLTASKVFAYIGCGLDPGGQPRTLQGASNIDETSMTVESCVDFCVSKGFKIAGLEFSTQCFCDNSVPTDRAAAPGLVGACNMPCSGNHKQICGGPALISLYQKCSSGECHNLELPFINGSASTIPGVHEKFATSAIETTAPSAESFNSGDAAGRTNTISHIRGSHVAQSIHGSHVHSPQSAYFPE